jgi:hypothetical protein
MKEVPFDEVQPGDWVLFTGPDGQKLAIGRVALIGSREYTSWNISVQFAEVIGEWDGNEQFRFTKGSKVQTSVLWVVGYEHDFTMQGVRKFFKFHNAKEMDAFVLGWQL